MEIPRLKTFSTLRLMNLPMEFKRYLFDEVIWSDSLSEAVTPHARRQVS